jgi:Uncharacterized conserved protein
MIFSLDLIIHWIFHFVVAFFGTLSFSVLFRVPKHQLLFSGLTGGIGWLVYILCVDMSATSFTAAFISAFVLTWISRVFAFTRKSPVTNFLIGGIFPIVPGAGIYSAGYAFFMGDTSGGLNAGFDTIKIAAAIALGMGIVTSLPGFLFGSKSQKNK